jgi:hypothetical protein
MSNKRRTLHFATPGLRPREVDIAPEASDPSSKRQPLIQAEDDALDQNITELDVGTKARNRAFQTRLDEVWSQTTGWEAKLRTECREAVETITQLREDYQVQCDKYLASLLADINATFDKYDDKLMPAECARVDVIEANKDHFVSVIVPAAIEKQSGEVSRQLKKAYETFDIEQQKEAKREKKFVNRASEHFQHTAQRFNDENALMRSCFFTLEEDIVETERRAARMYHRRWSNSITATAELNDALRGEAKVREEEDVDVLSTVVETQGLLQKVVLEHFGDTEKEGGAFPKLNKLEKRLNKKKLSQHKVSGLPGGSHSQSPAPAATTT